MSVKIGRSPDSRKLSLCLRADRAHFLCTLRCLHLLLCPVYNGNDLLLLFGIILTVTAVGISQILIQFL